MFRKGEQAKEFDKLIISLRTAYANEYSLDKEQIDIYIFIDPLNWNPRCTRCISAITLVG